VDQQEVDNVTASIMAAADRHCGNKMLSVNEVRTFLRGGQFGAFADWLTGDRLRQFRTFDRDRDGALDQQELSCAVRAWLSEDRLVEMADSSPPRHPPGPARMHEAEIERSPPSGTRARALSRSSYENSEAEKVRLRYITRKMSGVLHSRLAKNKLLAEKLGDAVEVIKRQRAEISGCHDENRRVRSELAEATNEIHQLKGMMERMKMAREYQMTARELVEKAVNLGGLSDHQEEESLKLALKQQTDENAKLREIVASMSKMWSERDQGNLLHAVEGVTEPAPVA